jgi:hypothetical protein
VSIVLDDVVLALPLPLVVRVRVSWQRKLGILLMFGFGILCVLAGCVRLYFIEQVYGRTTNPTWDYTDTIVWISLEIDVAVLVGCLPGLRLFALRQIAPTVQRWCSYWFSSCLCCCVTVRRRSGGGGGGSTTNDKYGGAGDPEMGIPRRKTGIRLPDEPPPPPPAQGAQAVRHPAVEPARVAEPAAADADEHGRDPPPHQHNQPAAAARASSSP